MPTRKEDWPQQHMRAAERKPGIRLDRCSVKSLGRRAGYQVAIEGFNLHMAIAPPHVTVGGVVLQQLEFQPDGRVIRGVLARKPRSRRVAVDYGFARMERKQLVEEE